MLYQYGWHGLSAFKYLIEYRKRQQLYRDYTATMQRHLVNLLGSRFCENWQPVPSYIEMMYPQAPAAQETNESAKAHVYKIFGITPEGGET